MDSLKRNFGLRVRELRKSAHMTQEQLAEKLGHGYTKRVQNGERNAFSTNKKPC